MHILGHPDFLTHLRGDRGIIAINDSVADRCLFLTGNLLNLIIERERLKTVFFPRSEPSGFPVVVTASQEHLRSNQNDLLVKAVDSTVVESVLVVNWHTKIT